MLITALISRNVWWITFKINRLSTAKIIWCSTARVHSVDVERNFCRYPFCRPKRKTARLCDHFPDAQRVISRYSSHNPCGNLGLPSFFIRFCVAAVDTAFCSLYGIWGEILVGLIFIAAYTMPTVATIIVLVKNHENGSRVKHTIGVPPNCTVGQLKQIIWGSCGMTTLPPEKGTIWTDGVGFWSLALLKRHLAYFVALQISEVLWFAECQ